MARLEPPRSRRTHQIRTVVVDGGRICSVGSMPHGRVIHLEFERANARLVSSRQPGCLGLGLSEDGCEALQITAGKRRMSIFRTMTQSDESVT
jgi:hypothetical protein